MRCAALQTAAGFPSPALPPSPSRAGVIARDLFPIGAHGAVLSCQSSAGRGVRSGFPSVGGISLPAGDSGAARGLAAHTAVPSLMAIPVAQLAPAVCWLNAAAGASFLGSFLKSPACKPGASENTRSRAATRSITLLMMSPIASMLCRSVSVSTP